MELRRLFFSMAAILMLTTTMTSCSKDEGTISTIEGTTTDSDDETANIVAEVPVSVVYRLLDKNGKETDVINEGDVMFFELLVTNTTNRELKFKDELELYSSAFSVFTSEGNYAGYAILTIDLIGRPPLTLKPGEQFRKRQVWGPDPLPTGEYYSPVTIRIDGKEVLNYKLNFTIN